MATSFRTEFDSLYLTANLPEKVNINTTAASLEVTVKINGNEVFSSTYFPYGGYVVINEIRSIVEETMLQQRICYATLSMEVKEPEGNTVNSGDILLIFCSSRSVQESENFLASHFLTTRKSALIPRDGHVILSYFRRSYSANNSRALIYYSLPESPGDVYEYDCDLGRTVPTNTGIDTLNLTHAYFKGLVDNSRNLNCSVLGVEYHVGNRAFNIFYSDEEPTTVFSFYNAFNRDERLYLFGATTMKTEVNRSEAICGKRTEFYDETVNVLHQVATAPLAFDEAQWFSQMFASRMVFVFLETGTRAQILITDISSEVTDSSKEMSTLKFSWKYNNGVEWI